MKAIILILSMLIASLAFSEVLQDTFIGCWSDVPGHEPISTKFGVAFEDDGRYFSYCQDFEFYGGGTEGEIYQEEGTYTASGDSIYITINESNVPNYEERIDTTFPVTYSLVQDSYDILFTNAQMLTFGWSSEDTVQFTGTVTSAENSSQDIPAVIDIQGNYPNPFNPSTTISFSIPEQSHITLSVYYITGQKVATLVDKQMNAGSHSVIFDGSDLGSGLYLYQLESGGFEKMGKMLLIK